MGKLNGFYTAEGLPKIEPHVRGDAEALVAEKIMQGDVDFIEGWTRKLKEQNSPLIEVLEFIPNCFEAFFESTGINYKKDYVKEVIYPQCLFISKLSHFGLYHGILERQCQINEDNMELHLTKGDIKSWRGDDSRTVDDVEFNFSEHSDYNPEIEKYILRVSNLSPCPHPNIFLLENFYCLMRRAAERAAESNKLEESLKL